GAPKGQKRPRVPAGPPRASGSVKLTHLPGCQGRQEGAKPATKEARALCGEQRREDPGVDWTAQRRDLGRDSGKLSIGSPTPRVESSRRPPTGTASRSSPSGDRVYSAFTFRSRRRLCVPNRAAGARDCCYPCCYPVITSANRREMAIGKSLGMR